MNRENTLFHIQKHRSHKYRTTHDFSLSCKLNKFFGKHVLHTILPQVESSRNMKTTGSIASAHLQVSKDKSTLFTCCVDIN